MRVAFTKLACFHTGVFGLSGMERSVIYYKDKGFFFLWFNCVSFLLHETYAYSHSKIYSKLSDTVYKGFKQSILCVHDMNRCCEFNMEQ